jgi:hypothetical protein
MGQVPVLEPISTNLTGSERKIFDYIVTHPNISKQVLVEHFNGSYSRMTVFKNLDRLASYNMIVYNRNPENKQSYDIKINDKNLLVELIQETDAMENNFLGLVRAINEFGSANDVNDLKFLIEFTRLAIDVNDIFLIKITESREVPMLGILWPWLMV